MAELAILTGDCTALLKTMAPDAIDCAITSPPYFGLRDYGHAEQIGLEPSFDVYLQKLVAVFDEVRRVLKPDGTLWLNMGDSYARDPAKGQHKPGDSGKQNYIVEQSGRASNQSLSGLPGKNLMGIPWRLAFALQSSGWYLRQDIIWAKPNPMPESVRDRCTKAHEYLFLLSKSERYYFDADAIKEEITSTKGDAKSFRGGGAYTANQVFDNASGAKRQTRGNKPRASGNKTHKAVTEYEASISEEPRTKAGLLKIAATAYEKRNKRSVWTITPEPFKEAHFATFPQKLVEPCMLAGSRKGGIVLDPFGGSGTVGVVAKRLERHCVLMELNPAYVEIARRRIGAS